MIAVWALVVCFTTLALLNRGMEMQAQIDRLDALLAELRAQEETRNRRQPKPHSPAAGENSGPAA